jgi:hypothetical protein
MAQTLHLYGTNSDLSTIRAGAGLLCELPADSAWRRGAENWYGPEDMLGSPDDALLIAHSLVSKLIAALCSIKDLPLLTIFEETLLEQVSQVVQAFHLDHWICSHGFTECQFAGYSPWLGRLQWVRSLSGSSYRLTGDVPFVESTWMRRGVGNVWKSRYRPAEVFRRAAPLISRYASATRLRKLASQAPRGGIWFYSTSYNCTKIGLEYEPHFPEPVHFLIEDSHTGGRCLSERGRGFYPLYAWSRASDIPSRLEVRSIARRMTAAVMSVPLGQDEARLRAVLLKSDWWDHFLRRHLPFLIFHERVVQRWCETVSPEMLVVGNTGWERALLQSPRGRNLCSVMLQHGVMHWVYRVADQPVSKFFLRGEFFQRVVNAKLRSKCVIYNYPERNPKNVDKAAALRRDVLFITTPYDVPALFHPGELREIIARLLSVCNTRGRRLVIRVHPLERISFYRSVVEELQAASAKRVEVVYSQGPGSEDVLARSCVAVLYFSTMFLDCLRHGIPIISFAWHWFPNKRHYQEEDIFNFAENLSQLEELLRRGIDGQLRSHRDGLEQFLAPTKAEEISDFLTHLWESRIKTDDAVPPRSFEAKSAS